MRILDICPSTKVWNVLYFLATRWLMEVKVISMETSAYLVICLLLLASLDPGR